MTDSATTEKGEVMGIYIPNMEKPKDCSNCSFYDSEYPWACEPLQTVDGYECPMVEIDDTVWENEKYKLIRMTQEARFNKAMAERRADGDI